MEGFAGVDGFIWFTGVIEDIEDPSKVGQVRVRIIGWHDSSKAKLPTDKLPWAQVVLPTTGSKSSHSLSLNDWVFGFFQDGNLGNMPVVVGTYASLSPPLEQHIEQVGFGVYSKVSVLPKPPTEEAMTGTGSYIVSKTGHPTLPLTSRTAAGSIVDWSNNNLVAVCDVALETEAFVKTKELLAIAFAFLKRQLAKLMELLGINPIGVSRELINKAKEVLKFLKEVEYYLKTIVLAKEVLVDIAKKIRAVLDFILGLPAKLLAILKDCLNKFVNMIKDAFSSAMSSSGGGLVGSDFTEVSNIVEEIGNTTKNIKQDAFEIINTPAELVEAFSTPASQEDIDKVAVSVNAYIANNQPQSTKTGAELYASTHPPVGSLP